MEKKYSTSLDYRKLADELWEKAKDAESTGLRDIVEHLKRMSDEMHNVARDKAEKEASIKNIN